MSRYAQTARDSLVRAYILSLRLLLVIALPIAVGTPFIARELILILGVVPLALGATSGSEIHRPLAVVYIGGFVVAIFFEQIVLPILYDMFARLRKERFLEEAPTGG